MSLYKQPGSDIWWASISIPGHPRLRRSTGETDTAKAQDVHDALRAGLRQADPALKGKTWGKAVLAWVNVLGADRSESDLLSLAKFGKVFKDRPLTDVTAADVDAALLKFCKTPETYTRYRTRIAAILTLAGVNIKLVKLKAAKPKPRSWITHEQWLKLYAQLPKHMKPMAAFAIATGLRQANVLNLTWNRVDLAAGRVWVEGADMKGSKAHGIKLSTGALDALTSVQGEHPEFVFTFRGRPIKEIKTAWRAANLRAGTGVMVETKAGYQYVGFTWHGLRHTWATWHRQNGTPGEVLKELGAWADMRMVENYAHHAPGYLDGFVNNTTKDKS